MKIINKRGPKIDPCGMPLNTAAQHENSPFTFCMEWKQISVLLVVVFTWNVLGQ